MRIAKTTKNKIAFLQSEASSAKSRLISILKQMEEMPGTKAFCKPLNDAIGRLEQWQNMRL